ncbi:MAG: domain containing protein, partial [Enterovirga sp.]|nr:domain containing protein [Enterovirga sp.]
MPVTLTIENETSLPDGGPLSYSISGRRGIDIGRDAYLDWTLPDPTRTVSGKHCEVRYRDGGYWLHDVSRNGTFLNRNSARLQEPHRLRDGDRIEVGRYIIAVRIDGEEALEAPAGFVSAPASPGQYWDSAGDAAPPISPRDLRPARDLRPVQADFREWAVDVPGATPGAGYEAYVPPPPSLQPSTFEDMG